MLLIVQHTLTSSLDSWFHMRKTKFWMALIAISLVALTVTAVPASQQMGFWRDINPDAYISPPANPQLNSVYMLSSHEGWAVGDSQPTTIMLRALPAIFHYDGSTWNLVPAPQVLNPPIGGSPGAYNLTSVTFGPPNNPITNGTDGWAVGFQWINHTHSCKWTTNLQRHFSSSSLGWNNLENTDSRTYHAECWPSVVSLYG